jgi:hypothetical protein
MTNPHCKCLFMRTNPSSEVMSSGGGGKRERERDVSFKLTAACMECHCHSRFCHCSIPETYGCF